MYYILQSNIFTDVTYYKIKETLIKFGLEFEEIEVLEGVNNYEFKTDRNDVFIFGSVKLARLCQNKKWYPGSLYGDLDYEIYSKHYKDHLLNYDSKIVNIKDSQFEGTKFVRPTQDNKAFNGGVYTSDEWEHLKKNQIHSKHNNINVQIGSLKKIFREIRFFVIGGKIASACQYMFGGRIYPSTYIGNDVYEFVEQMIKIYNPQSSYVIDVAETENGLKIIELNCINSSGFYVNNVQKIISCLEDYYGI